MADQVLFSREYFVALRAPEFSDFQVNFCDVALEGTLGAVSPAFVAAVWTPI